MQLLNLLGSCSSGRGIRAGATGFLDTFTGSNNTSLSQHLMDTGQGYFIYSGSGAIQSNQLQVSTGSTPLEAVANAKQSDGTIAVDAAIPASGAYLAGLLVRASDKNTGIAVVFENNGSQAYLSIILLEGTI